MSQEESYYTAESGVEIMYGALPEFQCPENAD